MQFTKLRLVGFKSFVEPTELAIEPGMTGIVGPNGCGKSNLVEALRWVMGENSAKRMRGGEMDDVIFGGTSGRPARNVAEVALRLESAPPERPQVLQGEPEAEVVRRIERGAGSAYSVNGREVRARDVQLLFADAATGAHSTALVSQGRIGAIINAKPAERRSLLEEAAGIAGLHSRRHEAELRLRAAETNLSRLDDVLITLRAQFEALKKQAKQAGRYRRLSEHIRRAEAILLHLRWQESTAAAATAQERLFAAERVVGAATEAALVAGRQRETVAEALPGLRQTQVETAAELQHLVRGRDGLDEEERRVHAARGEAEQRLHQLDQDRKREDDLAADANAALGRLDDERKRLEDAQTAEADGQRVAADHLRAAIAAVAELDVELARLTEDVAATEARRAALARQRAEAEERRARLDQRRAETVQQRDRVAADLIDPLLVRDAEAAIVTAEADVERARTNADAAEQALRAAQDAENQARVAQQGVEATRAKLRAESQAITELLAAGAGKVRAPLIDAVKVTPGFEAALGAAIGEDLSAPADDTAQRHWVVLAAYDQPPSLPDGVESLAAHVEAPAALARRLSQIGVVADAAAAAPLRAALQPGQRLVSRDGALWRWDGYTVAAGTATAAGQRLRQRNRLVELERDLAAIAQAHAEATTALDSARIAAREAADGERAARQAMRDGLETLGRARNAGAAIAQKAAAASTRHAALVDTLERLNADLAEQATQLQAAQAALAELPDPAIGRERVTGARARVAEKRTEQSTRQGEYDRLVREAQARQQRLAAIALEARSWQQRIEASERQRGSLAARRDALLAEIERLAQRPAEIARQREAVVEAIAIATTKRNDAADALAAGETALAEAEKTLKASEAALAAAREDRVRCESALEQARAGETAVLALISERLDCPPEEILIRAEIPADETLPPVAEAQSRLERLTRERDGMGPVNLMAEDESIELEARIAGLDTEREDLTAAIARLRQGISALNREGRERLLVAFAKVNEHFEQLFVRLFGGGQAHLKLDEGDDPLEAGLEIMASPPGKKLQTLSLLSGGEQALTALALLFAVFLTNPAPICVLDEVDAPLDDANVDRFCRLVEQIAESTATRFLVITHHRVTMARMDRLFGVTMAERGVSQLVSVDLQAAVRLRQSA